MVTLRREMTSDTKRRDYDRNENSKLNRNNYAYAEKVRERDFENVPSEYLEYLWAELDRSEPRKTLKPEEYLRGHNADRRQNMGVRDRVLQPVNRSYQNNRSQISTSNSAMGKLDKKGVVAIVAYFLIVAVIATLIIINGSNGATFDPATGTQAEISSVAGNVVNSTTELPIISQEALGFMVLNDGSVVDIKLLEKSASYTYPVKTNWFDKMCDALSFIAGG